MATTSVDRLRACLHVAPRAGSVCTVREADLREALSLIDSLRLCCQERAEALHRVSLSAAGVAAKEHAASGRAAHGVVNAHLCAQACDRRPV